MKTPTTPPFFWKDRPLEPRRSDGLEEFSKAAAAPPEGLDRRQFLTVAAASLTVAGFSGCGKNLPDILPYVQQPEGSVPGIRERHASGWTMAGQTHGLLVDSDLGRPIKIEGHPLHPASRGRANHFHQALLLSLYDEKRVAGITENGKAKSWEDFLKELQVVRAEMEKDQGRGVVILSEASTSPTLDAQARILKSRYPKLEWIQYEPVAAFPTDSSSDKSPGKSPGKSTAPVYAFDEAEVVISFEADIFGSPSFPLRYAADFFGKRSLAKNASELAALFVVEATPSLTGAWTPHRHIVRSSEISDFARALRDGLIGSSKAALDTFGESILKKVRASIGRSLFIAGVHQPVAVHAICRELNRQFGAKAFRETSSNVATPFSSGLESLRRLSLREPPSTIFVIGGNPAYQSPADIDMKKAISTARRSFRFSLTQDETSGVAQWQLPLAHEFETWTDAVAFDGTRSLHQPLIAPLFSGKSTIEIVSLLLGENQTASEIVKESWKTPLAKSNTPWSEIVRTGMLPMDESSASSHREAHAPHSENRRSPTPGPKLEPNPELKREAKIDSGPAPAKSLQTSSLKLQDDEFEILFRPDPNIWDGRFSENAWLQELPKPITLLTWGNAAFLSPSTAKRKKIAPGQIIEVKTAAGQVSAPAWILPGQEDQTITVHFGYGRKIDGGLSNDLGFNAYTIWNSLSPNWDRCTIQVTTRFEEMACLQSHSDLTSPAAPPSSRVTKDREEEPIQITSLSGFAKTESVPASLYPEDPAPAKIPGEAWAMVIDLDQCIGCNACTIACQSENNIPAVGKTAVIKGREMHWIRVDRYFSGDADRPRTYFQPVPCMHCEKAPCEEVCPVAATVHSTDGLNQMIYNRCVGTRYCANNCPYKVRRFNYFSFTSGKGEMRRLLQNTEVSVRPRGVMEKCTYCVQKINAAKIHAEKDRRPIRDGEVITACQSTCPTQAITFGNQNDRTSRVFQKKQNPRNYSLLAGLGTRPRTTYLAKIDEPS